MGKSLVGIISTKLTAQEIIDLPEKLNRQKPLGILNEVWKWETADISVDFLKDYWSRNVEWYINELNKKKYDEIYKYPSLVTNGLLWRILFMEPTLICISLPLKYYPNTLKEHQIQTETLTHAKRIVHFFGQAQMVLTYELGSGNTKEEINGDNFKTLSNLINSFTQTKRDFLNLEW